MKSLRIVFAFILSIGLFSCMTPRLGFPSETLETPVHVSLYCAMPEKGVLDVSQLDYQGQMFWDLLSKDKWEKMINDISGIPLKARLADRFMRAVNASEGLFIIDSIHLMHKGIQYNKSENDPKEYSGFDFSPVKDTVDGKYILAISIDDWGYNVSMIKNKDGPYMVFAIRLIDKNTNNSLWEYREKAFQVIKSGHREINHTSINENDIIDVYTNMIDRTVDNFFSRLNEK